MLISLAAGSVLAASQLHGADRADETHSSGSPQRAPAPRSSWEEWLRHAGQGLTMDSHVAPRSPDLDASTSLPPALGSESGRPDPEGGRRPERDGSAREIERSGTGTAKSRR